jgi:hypothetical protein
MYPKHKIRQHSENTKDKLQLTFYENITFLKQTDVEELPPINSLSWGENPSKPRVQK